MLYLVVYCSNSADERQWQPRCQTLLYCRPRSDKPSGKASSPGNSPVRPGAHTVPQSNVTWSSVASTTANRCRSLTLISATPSPSLSKGSSQPLLYMSAVRNLHLEMGLPYSEQPSSLLGRVMKGNASDLTANKDTAAACHVRQTRLHAIHHMLVRTKMAPEGNECYNVFVFDGFYI